MKDKMFKPQKELTSRQETTKSQNVCKRTEGKSSIHYDSSSFSINLFLSNSFDIFDGSLFHKSVSQW